ncbi:pyrroline-5-carboxylate reductase 3-like [Dermacentor albipictus]|uniref:pyrroline-5-carboxylate reductase 3-like n=1 Tax=Dermacentor albipictus TaxID=60249 RepID=UPI0031FDED36
MATNDKVLKKVENVGFIGAGNMAQCIMKGIKSAGVAAKNIWVSAPSMKNLETLKEEGYNTTQRNGEVTKKCSIVFLCVKPHLMDVVGAEIQPQLTTNHLVISVAAAVKISHLVAVLRVPCRVVRCMPNTCVTVGAGVCAISRGPGVDADDIALVISLLGSIGLCEEVSESIMDAVCGLSGSGPAYVCLAIQGMADGAVKMGMPRQLALRFAAQTIMGAGKMALDSGYHPEELKDNVCSPGGTTAYGLSALESRCVRAAFAEAVEAATRRAQELGHKVESKGAASN